MERRQCLSVLKTNEMGWSISNEVYNDLGIFLVGEGKEMRNAANTLDSYGPVLSQHSRLCLVLPAPLVENVESGKTGARTLLSSLTV